MICPLSSWFFLLIFASHQLRYDQNLPSFWVRFPQSFILTYPRPPRIFSLLISIRRLFVLSIPGWVPFDLHESNCAARGRMTSIFELAVTMRNVFFSAPQGRFRAKDMVINKFLILPTTLLARFLIHSPYTASSITLVSLMAVCTPYELYTFWCRTESRCSDDFP